MSIPNWKPITPYMPPVGVVVLTKIDDGHGPARNKGRLGRGGRKGRLWFLPDDTMYVYYEPTHFDANDPALKVSHP